MKYYLAPLEGITRYVQRNAIRKHFGGIDKFFTPFFQPHTKRKLKSKEINDILREHNEGIYLVPQILTNSAPDFLEFQKEMKEEYGYNEVNLNFGCPSGTVTSRNRGSGFLRDKEELNRFLDEVFSKTTDAVSIKTRLGVDNPDEFYEIMDIYNRYPLHELIVHGRVLKEHYSGQVHVDIFKDAVKEAKYPVCFNGDMFSKEIALHTMEKLEEVSNLDSLMIGRGLICNPGLIREIKTGKVITKEELRDYIFDIEETYASFLQGDNQILQRLKELWVYMENMVIADKKLYKKMYKCKSLQEFHINEEIIINEGIIDTNITELFKNKK